jgi:hypothetical protein
MSTPVLALEKFNDEGTYTVTVNGYDLLYIDLNPAWNRAEIRVVNRDSVYEDRRESGFIGLTTGTTLHPTVFPIDEED